MKKEVIIIGASGHGKVVADIVRACGDTVLGFLDDAPDRPGALCGFPVLGPTADYGNYPDAWFIIAIGSAAARSKIAARLGDVRWYTAIHPSAVISPLGTGIGGGTVVMANAVVNPCAKIGRHCIINTAAVVEHDDLLGDCCHLSVGAKLAGTVTVGARTWVGIGAVVSNNLTICPDCMIGAGAVVVTNINEPGTYAGVPARKLK